MKKIILTLVMLLTVSLAFSQTGGKLRLSENRKAKVMANFKNKIKAIKMSPAKKPYNPLLDSMLVYDYDELTEKYVYSYGTDGFTYSEEHYAVIDGTEMTKILKTSYIEEDGKNVVTCYSMPDSIGNWCYSLRTTLHDGDCELAETYRDGQWMKTSDIKVTRDGKGNVLEERHCLYDSTGVETTEALVKYEYDGASGRLAAETGFRGNGQEVIYTSTYSYSDANPYLVKTTQQNGETTREEYSNVNDTIVMRLYENGVQYIEEKELKQKEKTCYFSHSEYTDGKVTYAIVITDVYEGYEEVYTVYESEDGSDRIEKKSEARRAPGYYREYGYDMFGIWTMLYSEENALNDDDDILSTTYYSYLLGKSTKTGEDVYYYRSATGIKQPTIDSSFDSVQDGNKSTAIYNLRGQMVKNLRVGEIYIRNGRKFIAK